MSIKFPNKIPDGEGVNFEEQDYAKSTELDNISKNKSNSNKPIQLITPYGDNQITHPKVFAFNSEWNGYKYWMAYTPFPYGREDRENPCIAVSKDMIVWDNPDGVELPLDSPNNTYDYNSDTHLVYNTSTDKLECWWRSVYVDVKQEEIYRRVSSDGVTWETKELMYQTDAGDNIEQVLSPAIVYSEGKYKIWVVDNGAIKYYETNDGTAWVFVRQLDISLPSGINIWHIDTIETDLGYELVISSLGDEKNLYYTKSADNASYSTPFVIVTPNKLKSFDDERIYRSSITKIDGYYFIHYSGVDVEYRWRIGLSVSKNRDDITSLEGYDGFLSNNISLYSGENVISEVSGFRNDRGRLRARINGEWRATIGVTAGSGSPSERPNDLGPNDVGALHYRTDLYPKKFNVWDGIMWQDFLQLAPVPSGPSASGNRGDYAADANYFYFCYDTNAWIRVAKDGTWA